MNKSYSVYKYIKHGYLEGPVIDDYSARFIIKRFLEVAGFPNLRTLQHHLKKARWKLGSEVQKGLANIFEAGISESSLAEPLLLNFNDKTFQVPCPFTMARKAKVTFKIGSFWIGTKNNQLDTYVTVDFGAKNVLMPSSELAAPVCAEFANDCPHDGTVDPEYLECLANWLKSVRIPKAYAASEEFRYALHLKLRDWIEDSMWFCTKRIFPDNEILYLTCGEMDISVSDNRKSP